MIKDDFMKNKVAETLAVNSGNMIASLNFQVAQLQVSHEEQDEEITKLKADNDKLKIENAALQKKAKLHESSSDHTNNQQNNK